MHKISSILLLPVSQKKIINSLQRNTSAFLQVRNRAEYLEGEADNRIEESKLKRKVES